jgi:ABC-type multidrug transport system ATPase subunit
VVEGDLLIGRDPSCDLVLSNPLVSRRHARLERRSGSPVLRDLDSTNGTFVNGERMSGDRELAAGDMVQVGAYRLTFDGVALRVADEGKAVVLAASGLVQEVKGQSILQRVTFACLPGEVSIIAGTSGAGKTTLLNALACIQPAIRGTVLLNGLPLYPHLDSLRCLIGYVPQANVLHAELPLGRALAFSARLRLPPDTSTEEIAARVEARLDQLALLDRRDLPVKLLSGGQQKRASIAVELLADPPLLILDEPTTGLDPGLTVRLMRLLRGLADQGRTIIVVSHDAESFGFSDQVIFLAGGYLTYAGPPNGAHDYLDPCGYAENYDRVESESSPKEWADRFESSSEAQRSESRVAASGLGTLNLASGQGRTSAPQIAPGRQFSQLALRYAEILVRDRRNLVLLILQAPILAFLLAILVGPDSLLPAPEDPQATGEADKVMLLMALSAIWLGTINASREVVKEFDIWRREHLAGIDIAPYFASKLAPLAALAAFQNALFLAVLAVRLEFPDNGALMAWIPEAYLTLLLASVTSIAMGLAISAWSSSEERAMTIVPLALIPQILFAGTIFGLSGVTDLMAALFTSRWTVQALGASSAVTGYSRADGAVVACWLVLCGMAITYTILAVWLLARRTKGRTG